MTHQNVKFSLTLPNRGVITGAPGVEEMLALAQKAEDAGWDSVRVGDSVFAKPHLDALELHRQATSIHCGDGTQRA